MLKELAATLTPDDYAISMGTLMLPDIERALRMIPKDEVSRLIDLGCGYGGITRLIANYYDAEAYGADCDMNKLLVAKKRGINIELLDIETYCIDWLHNFDLVVSFGVIEHLRYYDNLIKSAFNMLNPGGYFILSWPNLGSFTQRIALLLGYQPNEVEISKEISVGTIYNNGFPYYKYKANEDDIGWMHVHAATIRAVKQLIEYYGFKVQAVLRGNPLIDGKYTAWGKAVSLFGKICPVDMCRRPILIGRKI